MYPSCVQTLIIILIIVLIINCFNQYRVPKIIPEQTEAFTDELGNAIWYLMNLTLLII